ncbi:MAG TPA: hypothetical protein VMH85_10425 [Terriglobales bacterium]|nr:hypothetical protein [Terriglobales bacterium]
MNTLNEIYSSLSTRRRYEVWFLRLGLADAAGAWWFRYLLMNPGRGGCLSDPRGLPVQVWATWFPRDGTPQSFIRGFPLEGLALSARGQNPFHLRIGSNEIGENSCRGALEVDGHRVSWELEYRSNFRVTLSNKGWIGFSRTPHSDACFSGKITLDGRSFEGSPLGFGLQGHNCGYRHRGFWTWAHAYFPRPEGPPSSLEALVYDMPFGLVFRKAVLWHEGQRRVFRDLREIRKDRENFQWGFRCAARDGLQLEAEFDGRGPGIHHLPYLKTDCSGCFVVVNNSLARAVLHLQGPGTVMKKLESPGGAVLEMAGG